MSPVKTIFKFLKKELMLTVSVIAAAAALFITPPTKALLSDIDWRTLGTLFMMLLVLEGFKKENIFTPVVRFAGKMSTMTGLSFFLVFAVFFSSMFVTNDVSLIIFVPLTIILFRMCGKEKYILPIISMQNIAAVRGSLLTPFGSPQNLFLYGKSGSSAWNFMLHMLPLCVFSAGLLSVFILVLYRKERKTVISFGEGKSEEKWSPDRRKNRICCLVLFALIIWVIVSRTQWWYIAVAVVAVTLLFFDRKLFGRVDYVLLLTFFCFFVFSSSIAANPSISGFLKGSVAGNEYWWSIGLSQIISNVPAAIVLWPFTENLTGLLYGLDSAGLVSIIGSLASVINYRIYVREYPGKGKAFLKTFTHTSLAFFAVVVIPQYFLSFWRF